VHRHPQSVTMEIAEEREKEGEGEMGWESREWAVGKDM
jgi:hypothetical protein